MTDGFRAALFIWLVDPGEPRPTLGAPVSVGISLPDWGQDYMRREIPTIVGGAAAGPAGGPLPGPVHLTDWGQDYIRRKIEGE
jgi:hypothetical protein